MRDSFASTTRRTHARCALVDRWLIVAVSPRANADAFEVSIIVPAGPVRVAVCRRALRRRANANARDTFIFFTLVVGYLRTHIAHPYCVPSYRNRNSHPDGFKWVLNIECARPSGSRPRTKRHFADERTNERRDERRDGRRDGRTGLSSVDERDDDDDDGEGDDTDEGVGDAPDAGRGGTECVTSRAPAVRENDGSSRRGAAW